MTQRGILWLAQLFVVGLTAGCACLPERHHAEPVAADKAVYVGGAVKTPGAYPLPAGGLTLRQALIRAGDFASATPAAAEDLWFATVRRETQQFRFPLPFVSRTAVGMIPLEDGDEVTIDNSTQTSLHQQQPLTQDFAFEVTGSVSRPGRFMPKNIDTVSIKDILSAEYAGNTLTDPQLAPSTLVVTRRGDSPIDRQHFVLPLPMGDVATFFSSEQLLSVLEAPVHSGDVLTYTRLELSPLVLSALLTDINVRSQKKLRCLAELQAQSQSEPSKLQQALQTTPVIGPASETIRGAVQNSLRALGLP